MDSEYIQTNKPMTKNMYHPKNKQINNKKTCAFECAVRKVNCHYP